MLVESALADRAGRSAVALRIGRRHDRAARRDPSERSASTSAADLAAAVREQKIRAIPGLDAHARSRHRRGAAHAARDDSAGAARPGDRGRHRRRARTAARDPRRRRGRSRSDRCGAGRTLVGDIEIVAATSQPADAIADLLAVPEFPRVLHRRPSGGSICSSIGCRWACVCRRRRTPARPLLYLTGSAAHFEALARARGRARVAPTADGLHGSDGTLQPLPTEDAIYAALGLPSIPPEIRDGDGGDRRGQPRRAAGARVARRHPRRPAHAHGLERRPRSDRSDGAGLRRARLRVHGDHRSLAELGGDRGT